MDFIESIVMGIIGLVMLGTSLLTDFDIQFIICGSLITAISIGFIIYKVIKKKKNNK